MCVAWLTCSLSKLVLLFIWLWVLLSQKNGFTLSLTECKMPAIGWFLITILIVLYSLQVKPTENPCLVLAKVSVSADLLHYILYLSFLHYSFIYWLWTSRFYIWDTFFWNYEIGRFLCCSMIYVFCLSAQALGTKRMQTKQSSGSPQDACQVWRYGQSNIWTRQG